jgi:hypothetical protein
LTADNFELRKFSFITLHFWFLQHDPLTNAVEMQRTIDVAVLSDGIDLGHWSRLIRAHLNDSNLLAECTALCASGKADHALKYLVLMRSDAALEKLKELWSTTLNPTTKIYAATALAIKGDSCVQSFLRQLFDDRRAKSAIDQTYIYVVIALTRLGDQAASEELLCLAKTGSLSAGNNYLSHMLRGFGHEYPDAIMRLSEWIKQIQKPTVE